VGILGITILPILASLYLSFTDYRLTRRRPAQFIGFENYVGMFGDANWWDSVWVTVRYVVFGVPLQLAVALGLALLLDRGLRGLAFYRSVFYLPSLLGGSVAVAILWRQVFGYEGLFNDFLGLKLNLFGVELPSLAEIFGHETISWIGNADTPLWMIILLHVWMFCSPMIIFLAGLATDPVDVLRGGRGRRGRALAPVPLDHAAVAEPHHLLQPRAADGVFSPSPRRTSSRAAPAGPARRPCSTGCTCTGRGSSPSRWVTPRRWRGCCCSPSPW